MAQEAKKPTEIRKRRETGRRVGSGGPFFKEKEFLLKLVI